ncbi:MAG TPA: class IV adenylate cyclase [Anaerolineae bacterium]|nr:class IV adenylate cyclase [Anaerolineae bacterium]
MSESGREIEAKFIVPHFDGIRQRVLDLEGQLIIPRHLELNKRYDTHDNRLRSNREILRVRRGNRVVLTYKKSKSAEERIEFELAINDFEIACNFLEALGYQVILIYEKYREIYTLDEAAVMLDELPFGFFVEVEGPSLEIIKQAAAVLGLDWEYRIKNSYLELFEILQMRLNLPFSTADFVSFKEWPPIHPSDLGLEEAIRSFYDIKSEL